MFSWGSDYKLVEKSKAKWLIGTGWELSEAKVVEVFIGTRWGLHKSEPMWKLSLHSIQLDQLEEGRASEKRSLA